MVLERGLGHPWDTPDTTECEVVTPLPASSPEDDFLDLTDFENDEGFGFGDGVVNLQDVFDNFELKNKK